MKHCTFVPSSLIALCRVLASYRACVGGRRNHYIQKGEEKEETEIRERRRRKEGGGGGGGGGEEEEGRRRWKKKDKELKHRGTLGSIKATMHSLKLPEVSDLSSCIRSWRWRGKMVKGLKSFCNIHIHYVCTCTYTHTFTCMHIFTHAPCCRVPGTFCGLPVYDHCSSWSAHL